MPQSSTLQSASSTRSLISLLLNCECSYRAKPTFSPTVRESKSAPPWKTIAIRMRKRLSSLLEISAKSFPSRVIVPLSGFKIRIICFNKTLLPHPERPMITLVSPLPMVKLMPFKTLLELKFLYTFLISINIRRLIQQDRPPHSIKGRVLWKNKIKERCKNTISRNNQNKARHYRYRSCFSYSFSAAFGTHSL